MYLAVFLLVEAAVIKKEGFLLRCAEEALYFLTD